jgi:hypothetical protein
VSTILLFLSIGNKKFKVGVVSSGMTFIPRFIKTFFVLMMEAVSTSEMSVNFYQTSWHNIPEDFILATMRT